ncbi:DUF922 domain-containing protein [Arvimicrobium flavum]|uniref:DUF922 domain-containing protein n=1 Tax=Arvimicrobium flavum TaxID=3393320 RepID=UPI00237BAA36|nr:DUF922 domain-containing protein [Mesorhizobium shangrilense]
MKIISSVKNYAIVGKTGDDLLNQMDRKGPKHGFLTRAIAQTRYAVTWDIAWQSNGRDCRVQRVNANIDITYTYPRVVSRLSPAMGKKWNAFLRGVRKHEETHGAIAQRMVKTAEKSVAAVSIKRDPHCFAARAEVKRRVAAAYDKYEAQQRDFDAREHRDGGVVSRLVDRLVQ